MRSRWQGLPWWLKVALIILMAWIVFGVVIYVLGKPTDSKAATLPKSALISGADYCNKHQDDAACSADGKVASVVVHRVVTATASSNGWNCNTYGWRKNYKNHLGQLLFWLQLRQYVCFDGKRAVQTLPPEFTHGVGTWGNFYQWNDTGPVTISRGVKQWHGSNKGAYHTWASDEFQQKACPPLLGCVTIDSASVSIWVTALYDGEHHG